MKCPSVVLGNEIRSASRVVAVGVRWMRESPAEKTAKLFWQWRKRLLETEMQCRPDQRAFLRMAQIWGFKDIWCIFFSKAKMHSIMILRYCFAGYYAIIKSICFRTIRNHYVCCCMRNGVFNTRNNTTRGEGHEQFLHCHLLSQCEHVYHLHQGCCVFFGVSQQEGWFRNWFA